MKITLASQVGLTSDSLKPVKVANGTPVLVRAIVAHSLDPDALIDVATNQSFNQSLTRVRLVVMALLRLPVPHCYGSQHLMAPARLLRC